MPALMLKWADWLTASHGFGGFSFYLPISRAECARFEKQLLELALKFPGIELDYPVNQLRDVAERIKGVNWLTAVNDSIITELGGRERLKLIAPAETELHLYHGGAVLQLGDFPQMGNVAEDNIPQNYQMLNRALKPVRVEPNRGWGNSANSGFDREGTLKLLARFDV